MMKLGLFGYGVVGGGVGRIADGRNDMEVGRILVLPHEKDVDPRTVTNVQDILNDKSIDTVIEVMGGIHIRPESRSIVINGRLINLTTKEFEIMKLFDELHQEGNTIILITHEQEIANYAIRNVYIKDGSIHYDRLNANRTIVL